MFWFGDVCIYWLIAEGVKNSVDIMVEASSMQRVIYLIVQI